MNILYTYLENVWAVLQELGPWLLFGTLVAGLLHVFMPPNFVRKHLGQGNWRNVIKASLLGVPMPLCSCGVIPAAIGLRKEGASNGAATGFLISTPQTGVDSITVSAVFLGIPFACFKVVSAFITGIVGGVLVNVFEPSASLSQGPTSDKSESGKDRDDYRGVWQRGRELFNFAVMDLLYGIWKWILIGVLISAAISTFVPQGALAGQAWASGIAGMLVMLLISLPLYVCATASVPIAASLVVAGMPTGAALVFLMAGPATNIATLGAVSSEFGKRITVIYIVVIATLSVLFGWLFDTLMGGYFRPQEVGHEHLGWLGPAGAGVLLGLFVFFLFRDIKFWRWERAQQKVTGEERSQLQIEGMTCEGCVKNVRLAAAAQHGVQKVDVDLKTGKVTVHGHGFHPENIREAVEEAGYKVTDMGKA